MKNTNSLGFLLKSISIYRDVLKDPVVYNLTKLLNNEFDCASSAAEIYSETFHLLCSSDFKGNLTDYIYDKVLYSENLFTLECAKNNFDKLPANIINATKNDLFILSKLAHLDCSEIKNYILENFSDAKPLLDFMPSYSSVPDLFPNQGDWGDKVEFFASFAKNNGYGLYSRYNFFYLDFVGKEPTLLPVLNPDNIKLSNLKGFEAQRNVIKTNTFALLKGAKANNMLLYGHRGTGKSSTVKAMVNEYSGNGLRLIEVSKENLRHLGRVIDMLAKIPMKFIVFVDDLTFTDGDDSYTALKAILEGSSNKLADNMALYATTNRRHMISESFAAREGDDVHLKDTLDESASLSDRFGITVTFSVPTRKEYLEIVKKLAVDAKVTISDEELEAGAIRWSSRKTSFSPRTAKQYMDFVISEEIKQTF